MTTTPSPVAAPTTAPSPGAGPATVGIHAPGAMGTALARCLRAGGYEVATTAAGRSPATARRLADAGLPDAGSVDAVVAAAAVVISVVPPGLAPEEDWGTQLLG